MILSPGIRVRVYDSDRDNPRREFLFVATVEKVSAEVSSWQTWVTVYDPIRKAQATVRDFQCEVEYG